MLYVGVHLLRFYFLFLYYDDLVAVVVFFTLQNTLNQRNEQKSVKWTIRYCCIQVQVLIICCLYIIEIINRNWKQPWIIRYHIPCITQWKKQFMLSVCCKTTIFCPTTTLQTPTKTSKSKIKNEDGWFINNVVGYVLLFAINYIMKN